MQRILVLLCCLFFVTPALAAGGGVKACGTHVAQWLDPASGKRLPTRGVFERLSQASIVLLGEAHTTHAHHRWQAYVLAGLHAHKPDLQVGFEMLPRQAQPVLDAWSSGRLDQAQMLEQVEWDRVWGYPADFYLPLLHFARLNRLPTVALNVDRELVAKVGQSGWQAVPETEREGVSTPAPASEEYRASLAELYAFKAGLRAEQEGREAEADELDLDQVMASSEFKHFVEAQLTWDRAMAEALLAAYRRDPTSTVVGIVGRGHLEFGHGIPHQLAALGLDKVEVLLPIDEDENCDELPAGLADAVFVTGADGEVEPPAKARLGVFIEDDPAGVRVTRVVDDSVAAQSGIRQDDVIQAAAGFDTATTAELIEIIQRQAPGTWLPLAVRRGEEALELVAKFPQIFE